MANERNAGRKLKYGEKTIRLLKFVPVSKKEIIDHEFNAILKKYETIKKL